MKNKTVSIKKQTYIKTCNACGKFVPSSRWIDTESYKYRQGYRPVCDNCEE